MGPERSLDPTYWYVVNQRYNHLVYRSKDRAKAKAYAFTRNQTHADDSEYGVISGSQLQMQGFGPALKSPSFG